MTLEGNITQGNEHKALHTQYTFIFYGYTYRVFY